MLIWLVVAFGAVLGVPPLLLGAVALVSMQPVLGVAMLAVVALTMRFRMRQPDEHAEMKFLRDIASSVSSGSTLRDAIRRGDDAVVDGRTRRLCDAGQSLGLIGTSLRSTLPINGRAFAAVCALSERTGSSLATTLHVLADRAAGSADIRRRRRVATAQARFSAGIVGIAPLVVTAGLFVLRGLPRDDGPIVIIPIALGVGLQLIGVLIVFVLATRYA